MKRGFRSPNAAASGVPERPVQGTTAAVGVYPMTPVGSDLDVYHGTRVADPFRWLEDASSPAVIEWTARQNELTTEFLKFLSDRDRIAARLGELWSHRRSSLPVRVGGRTFTVIGEPSENQPVLYVTQDGPNAAPAELLNPNRMASDGTVAMTGWEPSPDGALLAYAISRRGSDWQEIRIHDVETGQDFPELIHGTKSEEDLPYPNVAWHPDGTGFYYNRLPTPGSVADEDQYRYSQVYLHRLGTTQAADILVFDRPEDPDLNFVPIVTDDQRFLVLHAWRGLSHRHLVFVQALGTEVAFVQLIQHADARYLFMGNAGDLFLFHTNAKAPRGRVIGIHLSKPEPAHWIEVIPEQDDPIDSARMLGGRIVLVTVRHASHRLAVFDLDGTPGPPIELPDLGTVADLASDPETGELLVRFEAFLQPPETLCYDLSTGGLVSRVSPELGFDASSYTTQQRFYAARDGTEIPITLIHKVGLKLDGTNPVLLYGYGGFNVSLTPLFDSSRLLWLENGGVYAMASLRGGGEYGEAWHEAGMRGRKQTVFDDFTGAAEWLIETGYTSSARLAIWAESNGGLLVAACMEQRPELYAAVVCSIPVTDMLRYPKFTIGPYWVPEYGDAEADRADFETLLRYSPVHNVRPGVAYPPTLVTTGTADDRVVPAHALKLVAALQHAATGSSRPRLLRVQPDVGHGLGKPLARILELDADIYTFLMGSCGVAVS